MDAAARHLTNMPGATLVDVACDRMNEAALIFMYRNQRFGVDLHDGAFRFSVEDPNCPAEMLSEVLTFAEAMLGPN